MNTDPGVGSSGMAMTGPAFERGLAISEGGNSQYADSMIRGSDGIVGTNLCRVRRGRVKIRRGSSAGHLQLPPFVRELR